MIPPGFSVGLPLLETNVSVNLIYSEQADCFFIFYPSNKNELIIEPTALPAQLVVFDKADLDGSNLDSTIRSLLPRYQDWTAPMEIQKVAGIQGLTFQADVPLYPTFKWFRFDPHSSVGIVDVAFKNTNTVTHTIDLLFSSTNNIGIFTSDKAFASIRDQAIILGERIAQGQIEELVTSSQYFQNCLSR